MSHLFADTGFYQALLTSRDRWHATAVEVAATIDRPVFTTRYVLAELLNAFSATVQRREQVVAFVDDLHRDTAVTIIPASDELFYRGLALYRERLDKAWSLTDCISFLVMQDRQLTDALTADHHFRQAGFRTLLLDAGGPSTAAL